MKIGLVANTDWYLYGYKRSLAAELAKRGNEVVLASPPGDYSRRLIKMGNLWKRLDFSRKSLNPLILLYELFAFLNFYNKERFDLVNHFTIKTVILGSFSAKIVSTPSIINSITGLGTLFTSQSLKMRLLRPIVLPFYRWALANTRVIFQNKVDLNFMIHNKIVSDQRAYLVKGSGVDLEQFPLKDEPSGIPTIIFAARMLWEKGVAELVNAAQAINKNEVKAQFLLIGAPDPGNPSSISIEQLQKWSELPGVSWLGWSDKIPEVLARANLVCLPTYYGEGLPKILVEAGASGRPVVATDIPACREIIQDQVNGLLVPPRRNDELVAALLRLIENPELRKTMGTRAREIVEADFTTGKINHQTLVVYGLARND